MTYVFSDEQFKLRVILQSTTILLQVGIIIGTGFNLKDMTYLSWMSCLIAIVFSLVLWIFFAFTID